MAAVLAGGPDAVLGHRASAVHRRLCRPRTDARPEVTTPRHVRGPAAVVLHPTRRVDPVDLTRRRGVPVTTVARTLVGLADAGLPAPRVDTAVALPEAPWPDDFLWPALRLCVATDGRAAHATHLAFERDRRRTPAPTLAGFVPVRLTARQVLGDPAGTAATLRALVDDRRRAA